MIDKIVHRVLSCTVNVSKFPGYTAWKNRNIQQVQKEQNAALKSKPYFMKSYSILTALCLFLTGPILAQDDYELSYLLVRRQTGQVLAAQQQDQPRTPASTMKLVTAAAALERLGPEHSYRTAIHSVSPVRRGRLQGDLYLKGDADPELSQDVLATFAEQLHSLGLRQVRGDLIIDEGPHATPPYGEGWAWDDAGEPYSPEITGLAIDGGVVRLSPGEQAPAVKTEESAITSLQLIPGREGALLRGTLPRRLALPHSALRTGEFLRKHLAHRGITIHGQVKLGQAEGTELVVHRSRSLDAILRQALVVSDNLAMELIFRSAGEELPEALHGEELRRADGSGLSRYNLLSARQLVTVLEAHPELSNLVPTPGEGTLSRRFLSQPQPGKIRAKTGTLGNVSALAGYLFPGQEQECIFAILINGHLGSTAERKAIEESLVEQWISQIEGSQFTVPPEKPDENRP